MTALVYFVVAIVAAALGTRAWLAERRDPARIAFLGVGWCTALAYSSFALSLLPGLSGVRLVYMLAGCCVPALVLWCIEALFRDEPGGLSAPVRRLLLATGIVAPLGTGLHAALFLTAEGPSPFEFATGAFAFGTFAFAVWRLFQVHESTTLRVEKVRLRYLLAVATGAIALTLVEQLSRALFPPGPLGSLSISSRAVVLQGAFPPFSVVLAGVAIYFLYHTLVNYRLLDLYEMLSRVAALAISAFALVLVDGVVFVWVDTFTDYPFHSTFQVFLASVLFLGAYDPVREHIAWWSNRLLNRRGQQLADSLESLKSELPTVISTAGLTQTLLTRLHASGRVPVASVYLWDPHLDAYALAGARGERDQEPLAAIAAQPFTGGWSDGRPAYVRADLARRARTDAESSELLSLMDAMHADLTLPFTVRGVVLGWMSLRDEAWSDGFSADEIQRLHQVAGIASVVLSNIQDFQALEEEHRLAALGAMAAGLAHEIRNPLAGIKGAAQFLQHEEKLPDDAQEMLKVVVDEADRLNIVVTQFLDYARPFELDLAPDHVNALVTYVLALFRAQGLPKTVAIREDLAGDLPALHFDRPKLSQVLLNLYQNALQAMPEGGTLTVATNRRINRSGHSEVEIAVSDTGRGIEAENLEKLFIPFFTTKANGTGLGLAICQRIVQAHGGELDVQSAVGRGATFFVRLPIPPQLAREKTEETDRDEAAK